jgi:hypothetical protein
VPDQIRAYFRNAARRSFRAGRFQIENDKIRFRKRSEKDSSRRARLSEYPNFAGWSAVNLFRLTYDFYETEIGRGQTRIRRISTDKSRLYFD